MLSEWGAAQHIVTPQDVSAYVKATLIDYGEDELDQSFATIARGSGLGCVARAAGVSENGLREAVAAGGQRAVSALYPLLESMGLPIGKSQSAPVIAAIA